MSAYYITPNKIVDAQQIVGFELDPETAIPYVILEDGHKEPRPLVHGFKPKVGDYLLTAPVMTARVGGEPYAERSESSIVPARWLRDNCAPVESKPVPSVPILDWALRQHPATVRPVTDNPETLVGEPANTSTHVDLSSPGTVENLATQAMKIDYNAMFEALHDSFGVPYKEKIIIPMDDDDKARMQAESQQAASQNKLGQISAQGEVKKDVLPDEPVSPVVEVPEIIESPHPQDTSSDVKE